MDEEKIITRIVKRKNSVLTFIFLIVTALFFYFVVSVSSFEPVRFWGESLAIIVFIIALGGLFVSLSKQTSAQSRAYYVGLFVVSAILLVDKIYTGSLSSLVKYFYALAILVALWIALLDLKQYNEEIMIIRKYNAEVDKMRKDMRDLAVEQQKLRNTSQSYKNSLENYKLRLEEKTAQVKQAEKKISDEEKRINEVNRELTRSQNTIQESSSRMEALLERNRKLAEDKKKSVELLQSKKELERELDIKQKEILRQEDLKQQYSKSLRSIRKHKKEEEELLVVSPDGETVHRPKCISVRHILKESRKLIKNWEEAKKEGYKGCKLCKPHIKPIVIVKNNIKYNLITSKLSDKVHKLSCTLARNIENKDRIYFRNYRAALKKGYTACRVCNPEQ